MARRCGITGKGVQAGNNVSHAKNKTRRRFLPNLRQTTFISDALGQSIQIRLSTNGIRTIESKGGLDSFMLQARACKLSTDMRRLQKRIMNAVCAAQAA